MNRYQLPKGSTKMPCSEERASLFGSDRLDADLRAIAAGWLEDCFEDCPVALSDKEIIAGINAHYEGGWTQFLADGAL